MLFGSVESAEPPNTYSFPSWHAIVCPNRRGGAVIPPKVWVKLSSGKYLRDSNLNYQRGWFQLNPIVCFKVVSEEAIENKWAELIFCDLQTCSRCLSRCALRKHTCYLRQLQPGNYSMSEVAFLYICLLGEFKCSPNSYLFAGIEPTSGMAHSRI